MQVFTCIMSTAARTISKSVAAVVVEQLELEGDLLVTTARLAHVLRSVGDQPDDASRIAYELQRAGWLGQLRTRQAREFIPGARRGAYGSGDRFIEFRAQPYVLPDIGDRHRIMTRITEGQLVRHYQGVKGDATPRSWISRKTTPFTC
jgi:hypothetical protein